MGLFTQMSVASVAARIFFARAMPCSILLGTARMGADPARSVVNPWGRSHDVKNLFIVDGSLFVTSGGVNPTSTIQALALYIADQMKQRLANLFD
jgi:choline dehydrogenase-like flavoprotein